MRARLTTNWRRQLLLAAGQEHATRERFVCEQQRHCGREGAQPELLGAVPAADQPVELVLGALELLSLFERASELAGAFRINTKTS